MRGCHHSKVPANGKDFSSEEETAEAKVCVCMCVCVHVHVFTSSYVNMSCTRGCSGSGLEVPTTQSVPQRHFAT